MADDFGFQTVQKKRKPAPAGKVVAAKDASAKGRELTRAPEPSAEWAKLKASCAFYRLPKGCTNADCRRDHVPLALSAEELQRVPRKYLLHFPQTDCLNEQRDGACADGRLCPYRHKDEAAFDAKAKAKAPAKAAKDASPAKAAPRAASTTPTMPWVRPAGALDPWDAPEPSKAPPKAPWSPGYPRAGPLALGPLEPLSLEPSPTSESSLATEQDGAPGEQSPAAPPGPAPGLPAGTEATPTGWRERCGPVPPCAPPPPFSLGQFVEVAYGDEWFAGRVKAIGVGRVDVYFPASNTQSAGVSLDAVRAVPAVLPGLGCPLCGRLMADAVALEDGHSLCQACAESWFSVPGQALVSPCTSKALSHNRLTPNVALRRAIAAWPAHAP